MDVPAPLLKNVLGGPSAVLLRPYSQAMGHMSCEWTSAHGHDAVVRVLHVTLAEPVVFHDERLSSTAGPRELHDMEREVLVAANSVLTAHEAFVVVLSASAESTESRWGIDPELDEARAAQVAEQIVRAQLPLYRELLARGATAFFVVGLSMLDAALLREAGARVADELAPIGDRQPLIVGSDAWLVAHYALFTSSHLEETLTNVLPQMANVLARRGERARRQSREFAGYQPPKPA